MACRMPSQNSHATAGFGGNVVYALAESRLGLVLAARSARGICAILLGDDPGKLVAELRDAFPDAAQAKPNAASACVAEAVRLVNEPWRTVDFPLDIGGTDFQRRVWAELAKIPPGVTESYAEIARRIGAPKALRAVAGACAANILAVAIPCHRVLRSNGSLSGYRWGMARKKALIDSEKAGAST